MFNRLRATWMAGGSGMLLVLALSGVVAAASIVTAITAPPTTDAPVVADTTQTFEDANGNGIDDDCETAVVPDASAAASAEAAADLDGDGSISVSEAAQSGRVGGKNCNHGGYVSGVAKASACDAAAASADPSADASGDTTCATDASDAPEGSEAPESSEAPDTADAPPAACTPVVAPSGAPVTEPVVDESPNTHGKTVSAVAQSDAVGGKNCNHGGAVSTAAKDHSAQEARKAARDAARALRTHAKHGKGHAG